MDLSRLDTPLATPLVCVPDVWQPSTSLSNYVGNDVEAGMTMQELLEGTCPLGRKKASPADRFEIPTVQHVTPDMKMELAAIRLRRFAYKDKFMKSSDSKTLPTRFQIGTVVGGGMQAVGGGKESQAAGTANRKKKSGKSHLMNLLHDDTVKEWLSKNITKRTNVARPKSKWEKKKGGKKR